MENEKLDRIIDLLEDEILKWPEGISSESALKTINALSTLLVARNARRRDEKLRKKVFRKRNVIFKKRKTELDLMDKVMISVYIALVILVAALIFWLAAEAYLRFNGKIT